ncbi:MAG: DUF998 domain-containing protein [Candidatus Bathyarchaeota archaeon]|uniref:DUF998 domain-containing protein n=1 Tax=Candidatus Bathycorpusculum sp. TaxID=2994959 RepID=UPI00283636C4|nr:DUF998 domain-containing protein [Candidatus Termiticorpusculum sp.]MCL2291926.1 DUF998 domain-containing protein [Candidatus Termiticorpusculum sp.]
MFRLSFLQRVGVVCGFVVPIVAFCCIGVAVLFYPEFSWFGNALSDLGVVSGVSAPVFNFGLLAAGLFCFFFAVFGLFDHFKDSFVGRVGSIVFAVAAVWLMAIGVFNESFWPIHFIVAAAFFVTLPFALLILTVALYRRQEVKLAVFTLISSFVAALPWLLLFIVRYVSNVAIPEIISSLTVSIWIVVLSYRILKTSKF